MNPFANQAPRLVLEEVLGAPGPAPLGRALAGLARGLVVAILETGEIEVVIPPDDATRFRCDFLESPGTANLDLQPGDLVVVMAPAGLGHNGCVLGRVGRYSARDGTAGRPQDHVVIEAAECLTLKCGESSVDLRKDGKLMIQGNDVLSRAKRRQRIKGGTVAIN